MVQITKVLEFPKREGANNFVNFESLKGIGTLNIKNNTFFSQ